MILVWLLCGNRNRFVGNYHITSLLDPDNLATPISWFTHVMTNITSGQREMDLIVLQELIEYLNNPDETIEKQEQNTMVMNSSSLYIFNINR